MKTMRQNSPQAWLAAARPKTLSAALAPVGAATALSFTGSEELHPYAPMLALLCLLFAATMQVASNFINDLIDFQRGNDRDDRLGPPRACQQGWISPRNMRWGIALTLLIAAAEGLGMLFILLRTSSCSPTSTLIPLFFLGATCMAGAVLYSTLLSGKGLGDVMVVVFFGFVPVGGTCFVLTHQLSAQALWLGMGMGCMIDTLLVVNNYRDRHADRLSGKHTLIVVWGRRFGEIFFVMLGWTAALCGVAVGVERHNALLLPAMGIVLAAHSLTAREMFRLRSGRALNGILAKVSRNILLYALLFALALLGDRG